MTDDTHKDDPSLSHRDELLAEDEAWLPSVSHPAVPKEVNWRSELAQEVLAKTYPRAKIASYGIGVSMRMLASEAQAEKAQAEVDRLVKNCRSKLRIEVEQLRQVYSRNCGPLDMGAEGKLELIPCHTPAASDFIDLIRSFDDLVHVADALRRGGVWTSKTFHQSVSAWRAAIFRVALDLKALHAGASAVMHRKPPHRDPDQ